MSIIIPVQFIQLSLIFFVSFFIIVFVGVGVYIWYVYHKQQELLTSEQKALDAYDSILTQAHKKARSIIQHAATKAEKLLDKTTVLKTTVAKDIHAKLTEETIHELRRYQDELHELDKKTTEIMEHALKDTQKITTEELRDYTKSLEQTTQQIKHEFATQTNEALQNINQELQTYKQERIAQLEESINKKVNDIAQQVLGKSLTQEDHMLLIKKALDEAEKDGVFRI